MSATAELSAFVSNTTYNDLPEEVVEKAKKCLFNVLGVTIAGSQDSVGEQTVAYVEQQYAANGDATIVGNGQTSPEGAALANGTFPSVHHYDDTFSSLIVHPSASAFPAAYAASEIEDTQADGRSLLTGYIIGIETAYHIGGSLDPAHGDHGWHSTGTIGSFGAVGAAASVLDLTPSQVQHAIGIVASGSSSLRRNIGTNTNQLHTGHAAQIGLRASLLAQDGFSADDAILDGEQGYGAVMKPAKYDPSDVIQSLGTEWGTMDIGFKPFPSASISHAALEALQQLFRAEDISGNDVESLTVHLNPSLSDLLDSNYPRDGSDAHASVEYCLAVALHKQDVEVADFTDEKVQNGVFRAEWEKITTDFSAPLGDGFEKKGARIVVTTDDGREYVKEQHHPPGSPNNPLAKERLKEKFVGCAATADGVPDADIVFSVVQRLEDGDAYEEFQKLIEQIQ